MITEKEKKDLLTRARGASVFGESEKAEPKLDKDELMNRFQKAKGEALKWYDMMRKAYHYTLPNYNPWENLDGSVVISEGNNYAADIYDLTLPIAHKSLKNKILTGLTPKGQEWIKFFPGSRFGDEKSDAYKEAANYFDILTREWFKILDDSGFYLSFGESLDDMLISTGTMVISEGTRDKPWRFESTPPNQTYFEGGPCGEIIGVYRSWYKVKVEMLKVLWPRGRMPDNKKMSDYVDLCESHVMRPDEPEEHRYQYCVQTTGKELIYSESSPSWPWLVYRLNRMPGEVRGRGPSLLAYPTAATINEAIEDELTAAAFQANPMYVSSSDSVINNDNFTAKPGIIIPVDFRQGGVPNFQQLPPAGNIQFQALVINDLRQQIHDIMLSNPLGPVDAPDRTATEAQLRYTQNLENFMAEVPRLQTELFDPLIKRTLFILNRVRPDFFGFIPDEMRQKILSADGQVLDMRFETPLMTARGESKVQNLVRMFNYLAGLVGPDGATAALNVTQLPSYIAERTGVDADLVKSPSRIEEDIENVAQQMIKQETGEDVNVSGGEFQG